MIISRKKFEQEIEKARDEVREERNRHDDMMNIWHAINRLDARVNKLEGRDRDSELNSRRVDDYDNQRS